MAKSKYSSPPTRAKGQADNFKKVSNYLLLYFKKSMKGEKL